MTESCKTSFKNVIQIASGTKMSAEVGLTLGKEAVPVVPTAYFQDDPVVSFL